MAVPRAYSLTQKGLHWLVALMVFILVPVGFYMVWRGEVTEFDAVTNQLYTAHKSFGFILLWVVLARIALRWGRGVPAPHATLTNWQRILSGAVHWLLYVVLIAAPVTGWLGVSAYGARGALFGFSLPEILPKDDALAEQLLELHGGLAIVMIALLAMHIGAAFYHRLVLRDGVMARILP